PTRRSSDLKTPLCLEVCALMSSGEAMELEARCCGLYGDSLATVSATAFRTLTSFAFTVRWDLPKSSPHPHRSFSHNDWRNTVRKNWTSRLCCGLAFHRRSLRGQKAPPRE